MKTLKEFLNEDFSQSDIKLFNKSKIDFDLDIPSLALGQFKDFNIVVNTVGPAEFEATVGQGPRETHVADIKDKTVKGLLTKLEKKLK